MDSPYLKCNKSDIERQIVHLNYKWELNNVYTWTCGVWNDRQWRFQRVRRWEGGG